MRDECEHGSLRSKCEICERDGVIEELRARLERAEELSKRANAIFNDDPETTSEVAEWQCDYDAFLRGD